MALSELGARQSALVSVFVVVVLFCFDLICFLTVLSICDLNSKTKILWEKNARVERQPVKSDF